eukprot:tig00020943_g16305.t1
MLGAGINLWDLFEDGVSLQRHGALLCVHCSSLCIHYMSDGAFEWLGVAPVPLDPGGVDIFHVFPGAKQILNNEDFSSWNAILLTTASGRSFKCSVHTTDDGYFVLELEEPLEDPPAFVDRVNEACERLLLIDGEEELLETVVSELAALAETADRILVYRLAPGGGHGQVVAERLRHASWPPYLGLALPPAEIPVPAARHRYISFSEGTNSLVQVAPSARHPPDLSRALLLGHTPSQRQYYEALGVKSVLVYSIELPGQGVWGYLCLHAASEAHVPIDRRNAMLPLVRTFCGTFKGIKARLRMRDEHRAQELQIRVFSRIKGQADLLAGLLDGTPSFADAVPCSACAVIANGAVACSTGAALPVHFLVRASKILQASTNSLDGVWASGALDAGRLWLTDRLGELLPDAPNYTPVAAGALLVQVSWRMQVYVMWLRPAAEGPVQFAGIEPGCGPSNPAPPVTERSPPAANGGRRSSVVLDHCEPWEEAALNVAQAIGRTMHEALRINKMIAGSAQRLDLLADQMHQIISSVPVVIVRIDKEYRIREWNPAAEAVFGYPRSAVIGAVAMEILAPSQFDVADILSSILCRALDGIQTREFEIALQPRPNVPRRLYLLTTGAEVQRGGSINGAICVFQDVSALHQLTAEKSANAAKSSFMASMSQSMRAPSTA